VVSPHSSGRNDFWSRSCSRSGQPALPPGTEPSRSERLTGKTIGSVDSIASVFPFNPNGT